MNFLDTLVFFSFIFTDKVRHQGVHAISVVLQTTI